MFDFTDLLGLAAIEDAQREQEEEEDKTVIVSELIVSCRSVPTVATAVVMATTTASEVKSNLKKITIKIKL